MKKLVFATILGGSLCCLGAFADDITGYISDAHCGAKHDSVSAANTKCIEGCLKSSEPVIVADGKVWKVDADSRGKAVAHAGQKVKIDGAVTGDTVKINSIDEVKEAK
jgi:hypothetical protein